MKLYHGVHEQLVDTLPELLQAVRRCLPIYRPDFDEKPLSGAATVLLFTFVDAIGSYHRGDSNFAVMVDGSPAHIRTADDHFLILNSEYFDLRLGRRVLDDLYKQVRSPMIHNAVMSPGVAITWPVMRGVPGPIYLDENDNLHVVLGNLLEHCDAALAKFLSQPQETIDRSRAALEVRLKDRAGILGREIPR